MKIVGKRELGSSIVLRTRRDVLKVVLEALSAAEYNIMTRLQPPFVSRKTGRTKLQILLKL